MSDRAVEAETSVVREHLRTVWTILSWRVASSLLLTLANSLAEGAGTLMLVPLMQAVGMDMQRGPGRLQAVAEAFFSFAGLSPSLETVLLLFLLLNVVKALLGRWNSMAAVRLRHDFILALRQRLYDSISATNWLFFSRARQSDLAHALIYEVDRVGSATQSLLAVASGMMIALVYLVMALYISVPATAVAAFCGLLLTLMLRGRTEEARSRGREVSRAGKSLYAVTMEHLRGLKICRSYGAERRHAEAYADSIRSMASAHIESSGNWADARCLFNIASVAMLGSLLYLSVRAFSMSASGVLLLLLLFSRLIPRFSDVQQNWQSYVGTLPALQEVSSLESRCREEREPLPEAGSVPGFSRSILLDDVSFSYGGPEPALAGLRMEIGAGEMVALVGPSGAGKSTVADLLIGLLRPDGGRIVIDGRPLEAGRVHAWRRNIGYVAQDTFLFNDTVRANLLWVRPEAEDAEMEDALRLAAAQGLVAVLPQGMDTVLGESGSRLSGGERQRLSLARALLRRPSLLILDEATSAIDAENERHILQTLEEVRGRIAVLFITHRLGSVKAADRIYVMDGGRIIESGDWNSLFSLSQGRFQAMCRLQGIGD